MATRKQAEGGQAATQQPANGDKPKPVHTIRLQNIKAAIWANQTDMGVRYNTTFSRLYKDANDKWSNSDSFGRDDLLLLAKVADMAHTWVCEQMNASD